MCGEAFLEGIRIQATSKFGVRIAEYRFNQKHFFTLKDFLFRNPQFEIRNSGGDHL